MISGLARLINKETPKREEMEYTKKQFEVLYKSHYQAMYCLAYSITQDKEDSRDAVGEVFAQMWSRQPKINPGSLSGYLLAATRNQSISIVRRRVLTTQLQEEQTEEENRHEEMEHEELMDELNRVIREQLTEQDRRILSLHYDDDLTYQQTADALGISSSAVNKHITKSLGKLRRVFKIG